MKYAQRATLIDVFCLFGFFHFVAAAAVVVVVVVVCNYWRLLCAYVSIDDRVAAKVERSTGTSPSSLPFFYVRVCSVLCTAQK